MELKHTKGKWSLPHLCDPTTICDCGYVLAESGEYMGSIATVNWSSDGSENPPLEEAIANGKLISSAPELLSALIKIKELLSSDLFSISDTKFIDEVIDRATL